MGWGRGQSSREKGERERNEVILHCVSLQGYEIRNCYVYPLLAYHATKKDLKGEAGSTAPCSLLHHLKCVTSRFGRGYQIHD